MVAASMWKAVVFEKIMDLKLITLIMQKKRIVTITM